GLGETWSVPPGRAGRRAAASSVVPIVNNYRDSLRPCITTPSAPRRRATFHQALPAVRPGGDSSPVTPERVVRLRLRPVLAVIGLVIAAWALLSVIAVTRQVITWILVSIFLAMALNPAVDWFMR